MRYEFPRAREANLRRSNDDDDDDYLFAGAPNADDSFVKARGIATQRTATLLAIRRRRRWSALACGNGGSRREGRKKKEGAKTARKRQSGGCRWSDGDSENARAKGYEMKFSSHPFCVSEGIPVRQEVPSRNRRKRKKTRLEEEKGGKDEIGEEGEEEGRWWKWRWSEAVRGLRDIGRGEVFTAGWSVARKTVSRAQIVSSFPKGRYTVHSKTS